MPLLLDVWREACRHIELGEAIDRIARVLPKYVPADAIMVRRLDVGQRRLETVATGTCGADEWRLPPRSVLTAEQVVEVCRWNRSGQVRRGPPSDPLISKLAPDLAAGDAIAAPLQVSDAEAVAVLLLLANTCDRFSADHEATVTRMQEPLSVALSNDARLREMERLREALEADKRALLTRLDRHDLTETIIGSGTGLRGVLDRVNQVAPTEAPVLILGETGTGKEVIARTIHARSGRGRGPVERVNCGALPPGLIDSELFGHERGSFTGAISERRGWFERADGGTLFLDEVGELPLDAQVRLLRILQDGTYERVGGHHTRTANVRIVAATHRDLHGMVAAGTFREDLWYRISVFPIRLPPLRNRREDVPALVAHFAANAGRRLAGVALTPTPADIELVLQYEWPGNVRELAAVIERAVILGDGRRLDLAAALGVHQTHPTGKEETPRTPSFATAARGVPAFTTLDRAIADHIAQALTMTGGQIEGPRGAAALLGINPHTLRARMRKLRIEWNRYREPRSDRGTESRSPDPS